MTARVVRRPCRDRQSMTTSIEYNGYLQYLIVARIAAATLPNVLACFF